MRLRLDLSDFYEDRRKFSVVNINLEEKVLVEDVLTKINKLFKVGGDEQGTSSLGLFEDEFYIPPEETSTVLQEIGIVKVKLLPDTNNKKKKKRKYSEEGSTGGGRKSKGTVAESSVNEQDDHKRRNAALELEMVKDSQAFKEERIVQQVTESQGNSSEEFPAKRKKKRKKSDECQLSDEDSVEELSVSTKNEVNISQDSNCMSRVQGDIADFPVNYCEVQLKEDVLQNVEKVQVVSSDDVINLESGGSSDEEAVSSQQATCQVDSDEKQFLNDSEDRADNEQIELKTSNQDNHVDSAKCLENKMSPKNVNGEEVTVDLVENPVESSSEIEILETNIKRKSNGPVCTRGNISQKNHYTRTVRGLFPPTSYASCLPSSPHPSTSFPHSIHRPTFPLTVSAPSFPITLPPLVSFPLPHSFPPSPLGPSVRHTLRPPLPVSLTRPFLHLTSFPPNGEAINL